MEETKKNNFNKNNIKDLICSLINKQIGEKLKKLEQQNNIETTEIKYMSYKSKELINNLSYLITESNKRNKLLKNKYRNKSNIKCYSPPNTINKKKKFKKNIHFNNNNNIHFYKNKNIFLRKTVTPLKSNSPISNYRIINKSSKSLDILIKRPKHNKIINNSTKNNIKIIKRNKNKRSNRELYKTPVKKKDNNIFEQYYKTEDKFNKKNNQLDTDILSIYNNNGDKKDLITIHFNDDDQRISDLELKEIEDININTIEQNDISPNRISIQLGQLTENLENEKRIHFLTDNLLKKGKISKHRSLISSFNFYNNNSFFIIIEKIFDYLYQYLDTKSLFNLILVNKHYFKLILSLIITKIEKNVKEIKQALLDLKIKNNNISIKGENIKPFEYNANSIRAISLLNSKTVDNFFNEKKMNFNDKYIKLIFDLYFIAIGKKNDIILYNFDNSLKEHYIINHFKNNKNKYIGNILDQEIKNIIFNHETINSLYKYSYNNINKISPNYFKKINGNIDLLSSIIENILEHIGINKDMSKYKNLKQIYHIYTSRLFINQELIKKLKKVKNAY